MPSDLIAKLEAANIVGRGGAEFPAHRKWTAVRDAPGACKYVICNASEREPNVFKDHHILSHHAELVIRGMELAMETVGAQEGLFNMNGSYAEKFKEKLEALVEEAARKKFTLHVFKETPSYIGGEETALLNAIEKKRVEPRLKPPFPVEKGLNGCPTLIHNVETLYDVALVADGTYDGKRFYTVSGAVPNAGVYRLPNTCTVFEVLEQTQNIPAEPYFAQVGGGASGTVFNAEQLTQETVHGTGAIVVHLMTEDPQELLLQWAEFYQRESCGKCTPCREGTYQILQLLRNRHGIPWSAMEPILEVLEKTSFCALGRSVPIPMKSYRKNVLSLRS